jgi:uncharacterized SAM-binding protein YcdF (DUF218 family)
VAFDKLIIALISPLGTALAALLLAALLAWRGRCGWPAWRRAAWTLAVLAWVWLALCATPAFSNLLVGAVERSVAYVPEAQLPVAPAMLVLGGGVEPQQHAGHLPHLNGAAARVWYAAQLYHAGKAPLLLLSGGDPDPGRDAGSEAEAMRELLLDFGVPARAILLEGSSRDTRENARNAARMLAARGIHRVLLVTSALHMRRALALVRRAGLDAAPAATDFEARRQPWGLQWLPSAGALQRSGHAIKETVGWLVGD